MVDPATSTASITRGVDHLFEDAHTAYSFAAEPVSDATLEQIYDTTKWAPTALNSQPLRVAFVRTEDGKRQLETLVSEGNIAKVRSAPVTAILAHDTDWHEHLPALMPYATDPHLAWQDLDRRTSFGRFNASLQAGYFILAARTQGLVAGPMGGFDTDGVDEAFFPDGRWRSLLLVNLGHAGDDSCRPRMPRLDATQATVLL